MVSKKSHLMNIAVIEKMIVKFVRSGDLENLKLTLETLDMENKTHKHKNERSPRLADCLSTLKDRKGHGLIYLAAKHVKEDMLSYLMEIGLDISQLDRDDNNITHLIISKYLKSMRHANSRQKRSHKKRIRVWDYVKCCELLKLVLFHNPYLLTHRNNKGLKATDLLDKLRCQSSELDKRLGDKLLSDSLKTNQFESTVNIEADETNDLFDEDYHDMDGHCEWEEYFSGFSDWETKSHLDYIRKEEVGQPSIPKFPHRPSHKSDNFDPDRERFQFHEKHKNALHRINVSQTSPCFIHSLDLFRKEWNDFIKDKDKPIKNHLDIVWPPFYKSSNTDDGSPMPSSSDSSDQIKSILQFVKYSIPALRWLQINWHPDRFLARFGTRFKSQLVKDRVTTKVVALSQMLNKAIDHLRDQDISRN